MHETPTHVPPSPEEHVIAHGLPASGASQVPPHLRAPAPPQYCATGQVPQSMRPPQPSLTELHSYPSTRQVAGTHGPASAGQRHLWSVVHSSEEKGHGPQSIRLPQPSPARPQS
jgi:hypothetical protein